MRSEQYLNIFMPETLIQQSGVLPAQSGYHPVKVFNLVFHVKEIGPLTGVMNLLPTFKRFEGCELFGSNPNATEAGVYGHIVYKYEMDERV